MQSTTRDAAEPHSTPRVRLFPDYVAFRGQSVSCRCGWRGAGRLTDPGRLFDIGVEVKCPCCTTRLGVAIFAPTERELPVAGQVGQGGQTELAEARTGACVMASDGRPIARSLALDNLLALYGSMTAAEHARAHALLGSGLELNRQNWIESYFDGYGSDSLPESLEGHLPALFAKAVSGNG